MTYTAIRQAMKRAGFPIIVDPDTSSRHCIPTWANSPSHTIEWYEDADNPKGTVQSLYVKRHGVEDDYQTDYFAGSFARTIKSAIRWASQG